MYVLALFLKILVYILLILFGIILVIICIPYKYKFEGKVQENISGSVDTSWLFGLIKIQIILIELKPFIRIYIFQRCICHKIIKVNKEKARIKKVKKEKDSKLKRKKFKFFSKAFFQDVLIYVKDIINIIKPEKLEINGVYGFEDPSVTGIICAIVSIVNTSFPFCKINIQPSFEEEFLDVTILFCGSLNLLVVVIRSIKFLLSKNMRKIIFENIKKRRTAET